MSNPGPVTSDVLSVRGLSKSFGAVQALRDVSIDCHAGEIHALVGENGSGKSTLLGIASGFLAPDEGTVEIGGSASHTTPRGGAASRARHRLPGLLARSRAVGGREPLPRGARRRAPGLGADAELGGRDPGGVQARHRRDGAHRLAPACRPTAPRGREGAADPAEGAAPRRAHHRARAGGGRAPPHPRGRAGARGRRHRLRQSPPSRGAGGGRPRHGAPRRRRPGNVRGGVGLGGRAGRADDRPAAHRRVPRASGAPAEHAEVVLAVSGLRGERFGPVDLEVRKGEILGIAGAEGNGQVPFLRALAGVEPCDRQRILRRREARHALAGGTAPRRARPAQRRPARRGSVPGPERARERDHPGPPAPRPRRRRPARPRAARNRRARRAPASPHVVVGTAGPVALGRQPAEGVAHPPVPSRRRQGHPRRGADAGRRRRCALRHLRGIAREGGRRCRHRRQVQRPARACRPLRPRRRHVARAHRRGDPAPRARGAADRRGDRRLARG